MIEQLTPVIGTIISSMCLKTLENVFEKRENVQKEDLKQVSVEFSKNLEKDIQLFLTRERIKYRLFEDQLKQRNDIYQTVWKKIDLVSQNQWNQENDPWSISITQVSNLLNSLIEINREQGFLFDPTSRGFLLDLRSNCKSCIYNHRIANNKISWVYYEEDPEYPHGIKLWMAKSALRRSMVRAMQSPNFGDISFFDRDTQNEIRSEVVKDVRDDLQRGHFPGNQEKQQKILDAWAASTEVKMAN